MLAIPLAALYLLYRILRDGRYRRGLAERFGFTAKEPTAAGSIWLHAVSVGEILAAVPLLQRLRSAIPAVPLYVSTTTLAGRALAADKLAGLADGVVYAPFDYRSCVRRTLRRLKPSVVVVLETEIWPHLYREARRAGAGLLVVNGRISDRAFPRYRAARWFFQAPLAMPDAILAQSERDRERYLAIGAPAGRVTITENLKFDFTPPAELAPELERFFARTGASFVWVAASTMPPAAPGDPDEDEAVIAAFQELAARHRGLLLVLAPRKPERFEAAAEKLAAAGVAFVRRSAHPETAPLPGVLLLDSIGELAGVFARADAVFMGGTLAARGGHNVLEPAFFGKPVVCGPHLENFAEIEARFMAARALRRIGSAAELAAAVEEARGSGLGVRAREAAQRFRGGADQAAAAVERLYRERLFTPPRRFIVDAPAAALARGWAWGARVRRARETRRARAVATPVISIGNLAMGGAGKTALVNAIAQRLRAEGVVAAILTRGYGRRHAAAHVLVPAGRTAPLDATGDEAQLLLRRSGAHLGIGADRWEVARLAEERLQPGVFLLDDGFQHQRLRRDLDLVLVDTLDPFAGGAVFPLGRLREDPRALAHASAFVLTRCEDGRPAAAIEARLREFQPDAPVFRSRVRPARWRRLEGSEEAPPAAAAAFCGLGNPAAFARSLRELGVRPLATYRFADHHRYRPHELRRLAYQAQRAGAAALLTTEKDIVNLPEGAATLLAPLALYWLEIDVEIEPAGPFWEMIRGVLQRTTA